jgi:hypothetical protein
MSEFILADFASTLHKLDLIDFDYLFENFNPF